MLSGFAALSVVGVTVAVLSLDRVGATPTSMGVHPYLVEWCQAGKNANYLSQREAHAAALVSCTLLIFLGTRFAQRLSLLRMPEILSKLSSLLVVSFCLVSLLWWINQPISKIAWLATACAILGFALTSHLQKNKSLNNLSMLILIAIGLLAVVPGLMIPYDASWMPPTAFIEFQQGYSVVASQCDRISMGHHIFDAVKPNYGILLQVLCGLWEKSFGIFSFGENIQIIRWLQTLTVIFAFIIYSWYARKRPFPLALAFLLVLPWLHTNQLSLLFPNLSPWRSFGFPLAFLSVLMCIRLPARMRFFCLGIVAGICLSLNLETGVSILIGILSFIYFSSHDAGKVLPADFLKGTLLCLLGAAFFVSLFYVFTCIAFGYCPNLQSYLHHLQTLQYMTRTGYSGGFKLQFSPLPAFFFCHYCYVLFRASLSTRLLTQRECFRAFAATTALVWSVYYFNRPNEWYFQPQFFFYAVLLIDVARLAQSRAWTSKTFERRSIAIMCLIFVISPQMVLAFENALPSYRTMIRQWSRGKLSEKNAQMISGIYVHPKAAEELKEKAKILEEKYSLGKVIYLTGSTVLIPKLTGLYLKTDFDDPFQELTYIKYTDDFVQQIKNSSVDKILIDTDDSYLAGDKFRSACWKYFEEKLSPDFEFSENNHGWKVLARVSRRKAVTNDIGLDKARL